MARYCARLLSGRLEKPELSTGVLVGCGTGDEVVHLRGKLESARIFGADVENRFSRIARAERCVLMADGQSLPFADASFDFAAAIHSLEHVRDPQRLLAEVGRVLKPGAWFFLGVPNKSRLVGYVGSHDATTWQKISYNLTDYAARLRGRFENELGAHAGYRADELLALLGMFFPLVELRTEDYLRFKYGGRIPGFLLDLLLSRRALNCTAPAHYALCRRGS
jgi:SAM-dependent methyltransferase